MPWCFLAFLPGVPALMVLYLGTKNLAPAMVGHWATDVIAPATALSFRKGHRET